MCIFKYEINKTGESDIIFGYNGKYGVVTEPNGLVYMRARYYSPELRRFINADVIAGEISNAITLNRYAYANGNPVSNIDPFGLSADDGRGADTTVNYYRAIFVADKRKGSGLPVVGHTRLYFFGDNGMWVRTEFTGADKSSAHVEFYEGISVPEMYDPENDAFIDISGVEYVVWEGNFNESVELARKYYETGFGKYNLLFNNCSDYTDAILDVAEVEGDFLQDYVEGDSIFSVPVIREWEASYLQNAEKNLDAISQTLEDAGNSILDGLEYIGNGIAEGAKKFWDWISFWN